MTYERANSGKPMHELSPRHARRKLLEFKENAEAWKVILIWVKESVNSELLPLFNELQTIFAQGPACNFWQMLFCTSLHVVV